MILIDINKPSQTVIVTVSTKAKSSDYTLRLKSTYTKKSFEYSLGFNLSEWPDRVDEFEVNVTEMDLGEYTYEILNSGDSLETGYAKVINTGLNKPEEVVYEPQNKTEYYTYNG